MITERQEKLLDFLIKEYITTAEPVSSVLLTKSTKIGVSPATVRNDLQVLTKQGFIKQPHTSAGRIPTKKAYKYLADKMTYRLGASPQSKHPSAREGKIFLSDFIFQEINSAHQEMEKEMRQMEELMQALEKDNMFSILNILDQWHKRI